LTQRTLLVVGLSLVAGGLLLGGVLAPLLDSSTAAGQSPAPNSAAPGQEPGGRIGPGVPGFGPGGGFPGQRPGRRVPRLRPSPNPTASPEI
jgi:hypothetical protein